MKTVTIKELQAHHPKRFQKEYSKWAEYACDHDWWEYVEEGFKEDMDAEGVAIQRIQFSLYGQGAYAGFDGNISITEFMVFKGYDEEYPALYVAAKQYGDYASVSDGYRRGSGRVNWDSNLVGNTNPDGVFRNLDQDAWDDLVDDQLSAAGLEDEMQSYVDDKCYDLYRELQREYEHLTSKESFIEHCECNEITFEIEGETNETFA